MANRIQVTLSHSILTLYEGGWRKLRIARELGVDVKTVRRHIREAAKSLVLPPGSQGPPGSNSLLLPPGSGGPHSLVLPPGVGGRESGCVPYRERIETALEESLSAQRIYQDLVAEEGFPGGYDAVKRFVRRLRQKEPERFHRFEGEPGEEAQVDFGRGAPIRLPDGRQQKTWAFRIVLSYSRKAYSEVVFRQTTENFIRCLENAFRYFGGVTETLVIDNLRAAVTRADWYEPELNPKVAEFCRHYGTVILPARPRRPRDKGKVENSIRYLKNNALKARTFASVADENRYLLDWEERIADQRIHGTTRQQVARRFEQERSGLHSLPDTLFPCFQEARRSVHRDSFVEVARAYYEVPEEYIQREVWVRWDGRTVRVFNERFEPIAVHAQAEPGRFQHHENLTSRRRLMGRERSGGWLLKEAQRIGPHCGAWADAVLLHRGVEGIRPLYGLRALTRKYTSSALDRSCEQALSYGAYRLRDLKRLLEQPGRESTPSFLESHPLIRELAEYGAVVGHWKEQAPELPTAAPAGGWVPSGAAMDNSCCPAMAGGS